MGWQEAAFFVRFSCVFRRVRAGIGLGPLPGAQLSTKYSPKTPVTPLRSILHRFCGGFERILGESGEDFHSFLAAFAKVWARIWEDLKESGEDWGRGPLR